MTQQPTLTECRTCKKGAIIKQHIDFFKVGTNQATGKDSYILYDHGTKDIHIHKKACTYGCNTIIVWDTGANQYRDLEGGENHMIPCTNIQRYAEMAERQKDIIDPIRRNQMIAERANAQAQAVSIDPVITHNEGKLGDNLVGLKIPAEEPKNPIAAELDKAKSTTTSELQKTISFMWEMIKEIDRKVSSFEQIKHDRGIMLDDIGKRFDSIDNILADMLTKIEPIEKQFKSGSELYAKEQQPMPDELEPTPKQQPTQEELDDIFQEDESH